MKKLIALLLIAALCFGAVACGGSAKEEKKAEPVQLTTANIGDYIAVTGEYQNGEYHYALVTNIATADLAVQAYATTNGTFENVEITVHADLSDKAGAVGAEWYLTDGDKDAGVEFTFKMPASGQYNSSYSITCLNNTHSLSGSAKLEIVSVSGTFTPSN